MQNEKMNLALREETPDDEAFLLEVYASTRCEELAGLGWDENQKQSFIKMQFLVREKTHLQADKQIILLNGLPIGRMVVDRSGAAIRLRDIALLTEYRNAGIGSRLIQDLMEEATAAGKFITLHVVASSPAVRLYDRLGFRRIGAEVASDAVYAQMKWAPAVS